MEQFWEVVKLLIATVLGASGTKFVDMWWRNRRTDKEAENKDTMEEMEYIHLRHRELIEDGQKAVLALNKKIAKLEEMVDELKTKCTELLIENIEQKTRLEGPLSK